MNMNSLGQSGGMEPGNQINLFPDGSLLEKTADEKAQMVRDIMKQYVKDGSPLKVYDPMSAQAGVTHLTKQLEDKGLSKDYQAVSTHSSYHDQYGYPHTLSIEEIKKGSKKSFGEQLKDIFGMN